MCNVGEMRLRKHIEADGGRWPMGRFASAQEFGACQRSGPVWHLEFKHASDCFQFLPLVDVYIENSRISTVLTIDDHGLVRAPVGAPQEAQTA